MPAALMTGLLISIGAIPAFIGFHLLFPTRYSLVKTILAESGIYILSLAICLLFQKADIMVPLSICIVLFLADGMILFQGAWYKILILGGIFLSAFIISYRLVNTSLPAHLTVLSFRQFIPYSLVLLFIVFLIDTAIIIAIKGISRVNGRSTFRSIWLLYLLFPICQFLLIDRTLIARYNQSAPGQIIFLFLSVLFSLASDIALIYALDSINRGVQLRTQAETLDREVALQAQYYQQVTQYYEHLRQLRHDLSNHLYSLRIQIQDGRLAEVRQYAQRWQEESNLSDRHHFCSQPVADLFLLQTAENLSLRHIILEAKLDLPDDAGISNSDLICILGTLIHRAEQYCSAGKEQVIHLSGSSDDSVLTLSCAVPLSDNVVQTNPDDSILNRIAERYQGTFSSMQQNGMFTDTIVLRKGVSK